MFIKVINHAFKNALKLSAFLGMCSVCTGRHVGNTVTFFSLLVS